jgi:hypothetical protein
VGQPEAISTFGYDRGGSGVKRCVSCRNGSYNSGKDKVACLAIMDYIDFLPMDSSVFLPKNNMLFFDVNFCCNQHKPREELTENKVSIIAVHAGKKFGGYFIRDGNNYYNIINDRVIDFIPVFEDHE